MDNSNDVYVYNPVKQNRNIGRRTGKPIIKKRNICGNDNFDDYFTDTDDDKSINVTKHMQTSTTEITEPSHGQGSTTSTAESNSALGTKESFIIDINVVFPKPSTSAKESDENLSSKKYQKELHMSSDIHMQKPHMSTRTQNSSLFCTPDSSVISMSRRKQDVESTTAIDEAFGIEKNKSVEVCRPPNEESDMAALDIQHIEHARSKTDYDELRSDGLQIQCTEDKSAFGNEGNISAFEIKSSRKHEYMNTSDSKSPQVSQHNKAEGVQDQASASCKHKHPTTMSKAKGNLNILQENFLENGLNQERCITAEVSQHIDQVDPAEVRCFVFDEDKNANAGHSFVMNHLDAVSGGRPSKTSGSQSKNSKEISAVYATNVVYISDVTSTDEQSNQLIGHTVSSGSRPSGNGIQSDMAGLNFGGDVIGSVSNCEKAASGQFYGIKKRLSYSSAMVESEQQNGRSSTSVESLNKPERSFVEKHFKTGLDHRATVSGTFITVTTQRVSQLITDARQAKPLANLNNSTDDLDDFVILDEEIISPKRPRSGVRNQAGRVKINPAEKEERYSGNQIKIEVGRKLETTADLHTSTKGQSAKKGKSLQGKNRITETLTKAKKRISNSVTSLLDCHDNLSINQPGRDSEMCTFITLDSRRVSQLRSEKQMKLLDSLNTGTDSSDDFSIWEKELKVAKPSNARKRNNKIQETNKTGAGRRVKLSKKDETSPTKQRYAGRESIKTNTNAKLNECEPANIENTKVLIQGQKKGRKVTKKAKAAAKEKLNGNETTDITNNAIELNINQESPLHKICVVAKKINIKASAEKHRKENTVMSNMNRSHLSKILVQDCKHHNDSNNDDGTQLQGNQSQLPTKSKDDTVVEHNSSIERDGHSMPIATSNSFSKPAGKRKKRAVTVKKVAAGTMKNQKLKGSRRNKTSRARKNRSTVKTSKMKTRANNIQAEASSINTIDVSVTQHEISYLNINNTADRHKKDLGVKTGKNDSHLGKGIHLETLGYDHGTKNLKNVTKQIQRKTNTATGPKGRKALRDNVEKNNVVEKSVHLDTSVKRKERDQMMNVTKQLLDKTSDENSADGHRKTAKEIIGTNLLETSVHLEISENMNEFDQVQSLTKRGRRGKERCTDSQGKAAKENIEKNNLIIKSQHLEASGNMGDFDKMQNMTKHRKTSKGNCAKRQECDLNEQSHILHLKELEMNIISEDILELTVPVKLSSGKKQEIGNLGIGRKRQSLKAQTTKRKISDNKDRPDESTPVKLQLMSSLPNVTPQSGISFRQSRCFTSTHTEELTSETLKDIEFSSPAQKQQESPIVLTSCLKKAGSVRPRGKARRVRISTFIEEKKTFIDENQTTDSAEGDNTSCLPSLSSSPVHYRETTTSNVHCKSGSPKIVLPDLSYKIVRPEENNVQGLRRSSRTKVKRINAHKGEEIIYRIDNTGWFVVDSIQPSIGEAKVKAIEEKRRQNLIKRRAKSNNVPAKHAKRLSTHWKVDHDITNSTEITVVNPDNNEQVHLELIARNNSATWYGPDLYPVTGTEPVVYCIHLQQPLFCTGEVHMGPLAEKPCELTIHTLIFDVIYGKVLLSINDVSSIVETGDNFFIPRGTSYLLKNLRRDVAKLHFVDMDDSCNNSTIKTNDTLEKI